MKMLDEYFELQGKIYDYFGYVEDWAVIPIEDGRRFYWRLNGEAHGDSVRFAETLKELNDDKGENYYENEIYTQRFLPKWVYRGDEYTMVCVDTLTDGNKFLQVFDNAKEAQQQEQSE